ALHYMLNDKVELIGASSYSNGTTVYQGDNRFSLKDIQFFQHRIELRQKDKFFIRSYMTHEDAGNSYDAVATALILQNSAKSDVRWSTDYINAWTININPKVRALEGYPNDWNPLQGPFPFATVDSILNSVPDSLFAWHSEAREIANEPTPFFTNTLQRFEPGTPEFDSAFKSIVAKKSFLEGGSGFYDKSALYHVHGEYKFSPFLENAIPLEVTVGANGRMYTPRSNGTIFNEAPIYDTIYSDTTFTVDTSFTQIRNIEFGAYIGLGQKFMDDKLKVNGTLRMDKNQNFDYLFSPAISAVYVHQNNHTFRVSGSSAIRNPTLADQYLNYNVGRAILAGNITGFDSLVTPESLTNYFNTTNLDTDTLEYFNLDPVRPEKVKSFELGYRGTLLEKLYLDASYYFAYYTDFIGYTIGVETEFDTVFTNRLVRAQAYRVASNAQSSVTTQGFTIGLNYYLNPKYMIAGNYSWNRLNLAGTNDPIIPAYNTPEHKFNVSLSGRDIEVGKMKNWGFGVNYKWIEGFLFEGSPQFTGFVPSYDMVDAQINYKLPKLKSTLKMGASNLFGILPLFDDAYNDFGEKVDQAFNNKRLQVYGGPFVGRMAYFSILVEI
ncbi:MAG: TonB-dependent receptor, partial [Flavobacteriales bacterium]|nr:TonB-dependent receptor [Flavobacteriales bacterium]